MKEKVRDSTTTVLLQMLSKNASRNWVVTEATMYKITSMLGWNDLEVEKNRPPSLIFHCATYLISLHPKTRDHFSVLSWVLPEMDKSAMSG